MLQLVVRISSNNAVSASKRKYNHVWYNRIYIDNAKLVVRTSSNNAVSASMRKYNHVWHNGKYVGHATTSQSIHIFI